MIATPILARSKLSIPVNGVWVLFKDVPESTRRFCTPAFFHHDGQEVFDISRAGTAFLIRYRGRNFALCTQHQLGKGEEATQPDQFTVTLVEPDGRKIGLSPNFATQVQMHDIEYASLQDVLLLEYENERGGRNLRGLFLDLDLTRTLIPVLIERDS